MCKTKPAMPAFLYLHTRIRILRDWYSYLRNDVLVKRIFRIEVGYLLDWVKFYPYYTFPPTNNQCETSYGLVCICRNFRKS